MKYLLLVLIATVWTIRKTVERPPLSVTMLLRHEGARP